jgi:hypothetical protein
MMRAEPFSGDANASADRRRFTGTLQSILSEHKHLAHELAGELAAADQITPTMLSHRHLSLAERLEIYKTQRIADQRAWYARNSEKNRTSGTRCFSIFVLLQAGAITTTLVRIAHPEYSYLPIQVFMASATAAFGWILIRRFRELAAAYAVAAHEIGLTATLLFDVRNDESFSAFVGDTENAFSREHTQWVARKDSSS